jgi:hypothetical protein
LAVTDATISLIDMSAIITVFKFQLQLKPELINIIEIMSVDIKVIADAYVFAPKAGHLYELLNCLNENGVDYRAHFREVSEDE